MKTFESFAQMTYMALIGSTKCVSFYVETIDELKQRIVNDIQQNSNLCKNNDANFEVNVRREEVSRHFTHEMLNKNNIEWCNTEQNTLERNQEKDKHGLQMLSNMLTTSSAMMTSMNMSGTNQINDNTNNKYYNHNNHYNNDNFNNSTKCKQITSELYLTIDYNVEFTRAIFPIPLLEVSRSNNNANNLSENVVRCVIDHSEQELHHHHHSCSNNNANNNNINGIQLTNSITNNNTNAGDSEANEREEIDNINELFVIEKCKKEEEKKSLPFAETLETFTTTPEVAQRSQFEGVTSDVNSVNTKTESSQENVELKCVVNNLHELQQKLEEVERINERLSRENEALRRLSKEKMIEMQKLCEVFQSRVDTNTELSRLRSKNTELRLRLEDAEAALAEMHSESNKSYTENYTNAVKMCREQKRSNSQQQGIIISSSSRSNTNKSYRYMSRRNNDYSRLLRKVTNPEGVNVINSQENRALHTNKANAITTKNDISYDIDSNKNSGEQRKIVKQPNLSARSSLEMRNVDRSNNINMRHRQQESSERSRNKTNSINSVYDARVRRVNRFDTPHKLKSSKECNVKRLPFKIAQHSYNRFRTPSAHLENSRNESNYTRASKLRSVNYRDANIDNALRRRKLDGNNVSDVDSADFSKTKKSKIKINHEEHEHEPSHSRQSSLSFQSTQSIQSSLCYSKKEEQSYDNNYNSNYDHNRRRLRRSAPAVKRNSSLCESDIESSNVILTQKRKKGLNRLNSPHHGVEYCNSHSCLPFNDVSWHKPPHRSLSSSARSDSSYNRLYSTPTESSRRRAVSPYEVPFTTREKRAVFYEIN